MTISDLQPSLLWTNFVRLNSIPRPSYGEKDIQQYLLDFAKKLGLPARQDKAGNVIIEKPATKGLENRKTILLQAHTDMVTEPKEHPNWSKPIPMEVVEGWVKASGGSTLGADNGIGAAAAMALLESSDIPHPPLSALFTVTEETGLVGARALDPNLVKNADILFNMDTEDDDELCISCAGAIGTEGTKIYKAVPLPSTCQLFSLRISGLTGGHSGVEIHQGFANANKLMARLLYELPKSYGLHLLSWDGGGARNVIPRNASVEIGIEPSAATRFHALLAERTAAIQEEFSKKDPKITVEVVQMPAAKGLMCMPTAVYNQLLRYAMAVPNGVFRMSPEVEGLVEASSNLARIEAKDGKIYTESLQRSSRESSKAEVRMAVRAALTSNGFKVKHKDGYPGWTPDPHSEMLAVAKAAYKKKFNDAPRVTNIHAGLECGVIKNRLSKHNLDCLSFGPNIRGAHSPEERVEVASVQKFWEYLLLLLEMTPLNLTFPKI